MPDIHTRLINIAPQIGQLQIAHADGWAYLVAPDGQPLAHWRARETFWRRFDSPVALALFIPAPLEGPANPEVTPNPAKAPWYFLGLQELVGYSALMGGVIIPGIVVMGLALIPFMDREQRSIGTWFTDRPGRRWAYFGFLYGALVTCLCVASSILFPVRSVFSGFESQLFFDLVNPATLLVALCAVLYFVVARVTKSTRHAAIATFCAFIIAFILLTYIGTALRGPNWEFYWPWQAWSEHPGRI